MTSWPWEVDIDTDHGALARTMKALLLTGSTLTSSLMFGRETRLGCKRTAFLLVQIPASREQDFRRIAQPIEMRAPSRLQFGTDPPADDGHPGRPR